MRLRIDELAMQTGTTSRNIRAYQAKGLLPPPDLDGRTGFYGEDHVRRLELINELQERGFSLEAIRQVIEIWSRGGDMGHLIGFHHLVAAPFSDEEPEVHDMADLLETFPDAKTQPDQIQRAAALGVIELTDDGRILVPSPMLFDAGRELTTLGVPMKALLDLVEALQVDVQDMTDRFLRIVGEYALPQLLADTDPDDTRERFSTTLASLEKLRPVAMEIARPFLARAMRVSIDDTLAEFSRELERVAEAAGDGSDHAAEVGHAPEGTAGD